MTAVARDLIRERHSPSPTTDLEVGAVMALLRASEARSPTRVLALFEQHPALLEVLGWSSPGPSLTPTDHETLRTRAWLLLSEDLLGELRALHQREVDPSEDPDSPGEASTRPFPLQADDLDHWRSPRRDRLHQRLKRLRPGSTTGLFAVMDPQGHVQTDPVLIADILASHWRSVFSAQPIDEDRLDTWLLEDAAGNAEV